MKNPDTDQGIGKGLIFSTWWTFDLADVRVEQPDGFHEKGTHEGKFVGVRRPYEWGVGVYRLTLEREEEDRDGDWFGLSIKREGDEAESASTRIGSLRFKRRDASVPARIRADGITFLEV